MEAGQLNPSGQLNSNSFSGKFYISFF